MPDGFQARLARVLGHYGVTGLDRTPELEAAVFRIFLAQQRMAADAAVVCRAAAAVAGERAAGRAAARAGRAGAGAPRRGHAACASPPCPTSPAAWCSAGSPSRCCAATGPGSTPRSAATCATWTAPGRAGPRRADRRPWWPAPSRWCGCSASGSSAASADHAPLLEVLTRRYYGNRGLADVTRARRRGLPLRHRRRTPPHGAAADHAWPPRPSTSPALPGAIARRRASCAADVRRARPGRRPLPHLGRPARTPTASAARARRAAGGRAPLPGAVAPDHRHGRRHAAARRCTTTSPSGPSPAGLRRGPADPRPAPAGRPAAAAGAAARVRPHPAAVGGRGDLPVPVRRPRATPPTSGWSRWPRSAT